ncbi:hypothetical protein ACFPES_07485 [Paenibacillus sp. GCM10023248]|nr:hypothetical protein [Paenibacillus sp. MAHUQ-63]
MIPGPVFFLVIPKEGGIFGFAALAAWIYLKKDDRAKIVDVHAGLKMG